MQNLKPSKSILFLKKKKMHIQFLTGSTPQLTVKAPLCTSPIPTTAQESQALLHKTQGATRAMANMDHLPSFCRLAGLSV